MENHKNDLRIGFTRNVNLVSLHGKGIDEVLVETHELLSDIILILGSNLASGEARVNGLLNPQDVGKVMPAPGVWYRLQSTILPQEGTVFLQEAFERRAARLQRVRDTILRGYRYNLRRR